MHPVSMTHLLATFLMYSSDNGIGGCSVNPDPLKSSGMKTDDEGTEKVVISILRMQALMSPGERLDFWKRIQRFYCRDCGRSVEPSGACPVCDK